MTAPTSATTTRVRPRLARLARLMPAALVAALLPLGAAVQTAAPAAAEVSSTPSTGAYVTNGRVDAVLPVGSRVYLGGSFTLIGPSTGLATVVDGTSGALASSWGLAGGSVLASAPDGAGGWFIGGLFTVPGGVRQANAAHILANGQLDQTWVPRPNDTVRAMVYDAASHTVFLGGDFANVNGVAHAHLAAVNDTTGALQPAFTATTSELVRSLATDPTNNQLWVGGDFHTVDNVSHVGLAAVDMTTGALSGLTVATTNGPVRALALSHSSDQVFVGGAFTTLGGVATSHLGAVTASTGARLAGFTAAASASVDSLLLSSEGSALYAGGEFTTVNGVSSPLLVRLALGTGAVDRSFTPGFSTACTPTNPDTPCTAGVRALSAGSTTTSIEAGGAFLQVHALSRYNAAELGDDGTPTAWNPVANAPVDAIGVGGTGVTPSVLLAGELTSVNALYRENIAAVSRTSGVLDPTFHPGANGQVRALVASTDGSQLWLGGDFSTVGGVARTRLAALNTTTNVVAAAFHPSMTKSVEALHLIGNELYLGGNFGSVSGVKTKYLSAVNATTGAVSTTFRPNPDNIVEALGSTSTGGTLWVGGSYATIGGHKYAGLAAISPTTGAAYSWRPSPNPSRVMAISYIPGSVCMGSRSNQMACYNTSTGKSQIWATGDGNVQAVTAFAGTLYAGGHFNVVHAAGLYVTRRKLASYSIATGALLPWTATINSALGVFAVTAESEGLYVGGDFTEVTGFPQSGYAVLPGSP